MRKRKKFLSNNPLQKRFLFLILLSIFVPLIFVSACLYYLIFQILADQLAIPEFIAQNLLPALRKINVMLMVGLPPLVVVLFFWASALSHRLIGPLERLEEDLKKIADGDYSIRLKIRQDDELHPIVGAINRIIDKLENK